jgi:hypothetical protein
MQDKLGAWMTDTSSRRWSVGCRLMMWRYNTQIHRTVKEIPYRLVFGQKPRVGISGLHLDYSLLDKLATEADLNKVCNYEGKEEDVVDAGAVVAGKMDVDDEVAEVVSPNKVADTAIAQLQSYEEGDVGPGNLLDTEQQEQRQCDWAQAILCDSPQMIAYRCHTDGCTKVIHHHCQSGWEQREGYDANISLLCCEHHPDYKDKASPENIAWNDQNICGAIDAQNPSESPKKKSTNDSELTEWQTMTY